MPQGSDGLRRPGWLRLPDLAPPRAGLHAAGLDELLEPLEVGLDLGVVGPDDRPGLLGKALGLPVDLRHHAGDVVVEGDGHADPTSVLATAKHFAGYSETQGGRDASEADLTPRKLRSWFLPPFERVAREGCGTFMLGYQAVDGVPVTVNPWLLDGVLRGEWGYTGALVTDWDNVGRMVWEHRVFPDQVAAAVAAVRAGNDVIMTTPAFFDAAQEAVRTGLLDAAARRIAVVGPLADDPHAHLGDWAGASGQVRRLMPDGHPRHLTETVLDGLRTLTPESWAVEWPAVRVRRGAELDDRRVRGPGGARGAGACRRRRARPGDAREHRPAAGASSSRGGSSCGSVRRHGLSRSSGSASRSGRAAGRVGVA